MSTHTSAVSDQDASDDPEPGGFGYYIIDEVHPASLSVSGEGSAGGWLLEDGDLEEQELKVTYDPNGVHLTLDANGPEVYTGASAAFTAETARALGAALYEAADELERRREVDR